MGKIRKYKVFSIFLLVIILTSTVPNYVLGGGDNEKGKGKGKGKGKPSEDKSAEFVLMFSGLDLDFGTIDFSGIEYFIDGVSYFTDASGIINMEFNDKLTHNFTLIWHGVLYERIFNSSISEIVSLATKSIDAQLVWDEIFINIGGVFLEDTFDLLYFNGTSWILIQTVVRSGTGIIVLNSLAMGSYMIVKTGELLGVVFTIDLLTITYTTDIPVTPSKTVITFEYINSIFGVDYPVDFTSIDWTLQFLSTVSGWNPTTSVYYVYFDTSDGANGRMVIYEILLYTDYDYRLVIGNSWNTNYNLNETGLTEINLVAKSLDAEFLWSSDSTPVVGTDFELFWFNGTDFVSIGTYTTDVNGKVIITEMLPIGTYMFENYAAFSIVADDSMKIETYSVESVFDGLDTQVLEWERKLELFSFFMYIKKR